MEKVIVKKSGGIVHARINRPEVLNACDGETYSAIADAWEDLENDPNLRVGIVSGEGRAFCVGTDIKWVKSPDAEGLVDRLYPRMLTLTKPVIAAIQGHCKGIDADITVFDPETITDRATIEQPFETAEGVEYFVVNGSVLISRGKMNTDVLPGRAICRK